MPIYKTTFFFTQRKQGWSETFYQNAANAMTALTNVGPKVAMRVRLLGGIGTGASDPRFEAYRVSNVEIDRDSLLGGPEFDDQFNSSPLGVADNPSLALLVRCEAGDLYRRSWFLRGFPDALVTNNGIFVDNPGWSPRFNTFVNSLIVTGWGMLAWDRSAPILVIESFSPPDPVIKNRVTVTTVLPHGLVAGNKFKISSATGTQNLRGTWTVFAAPTANTVQFFTKKEYTGVYIGGGKLQKKTPILVPFTRLILERATHRITGRPFDLPVGRRRARATA